MQLILNQIQKSYRYVTGLERRILNGLSLQVTDGAFISVAGPSGSGKTTLLNIIGALDRPDFGQVLFNGTDISTFTPKELAVYHNQAIGFVFQHHHLLPQCTLLENVLLPTIPLKNSQWKKESTIRAYELLKRTGIWDHRDQRPGQLSGGECQRAAVVRALVNNPYLLLADEPTGALDQRHSNILADLLIELNQTDRVTLIMVTHDLQLAARAKERYWLDEGKLKKWQ